MEWQMDRKEFSVRENVCEENVCEACAATFGCCNKAMQSRIEETGEFEAKIRNDPWSLMDATKL